MEPLDAKLRALVAKWRKESDHAMNVSIVDGSHHELGASVAITDCANELAAVLDEERVNECPHAWSQWRGCMRASASGDYEIRDCALCSKRERRDT